MRTMIFLTICIMIIASACVGTPQKQNRACDAEAENVVKLINDYHFTGDHIHADSALILLDRVIDHCPKWKNNMMLRKALLFNDMAKYKDAISIISSFNEADLPALYNKSIITNKINANEALSRNDTIAYRLYIRQVTDEYGRMLSSKKEQVDSILALNNYENIVKNDLTPLVEIYYYHKSKLESKEQIIDEINKLERDIDGNRMYFDRLRSYFQENGNTHIGILFE